MEIIKIYKDGQLIAKGEELLVELKNIILRIKGDEIFYEPKKIKNKLDCFIVR